VTAQIGDKILISGVKKTILGELPVDDSVALDVPGEGMGSACWRGHVATWEVRDAKVFLTGLTGNLRLKSPEPVQAVWLNGVIRIADGDLVSYIHSGYMSGYAAVIELDIVGGAIRRQRRLTAADDGVRSGISDDTPAWEFLPGAGELFVPAGATGGRCGDDPDPAEGEPEFESYEGNHLRERITAERQARGLRHGAAMALAGYPASKGGRLAEWERGQGSIDRELEQRLCAAFGITGSERIECNQKDQAGYQAALDAWADELIEPTLKVFLDSYCLCYAAPVKYRESRKALEEWAVKCVNVIWHPAELILSRRESLYFDSMGNEIKGSEMVGADFDAET
jgi:hypothetical protein